jgi:hypothetical protein
VVELLPRLEAFRRFMKDEVPLRILLLGDGMNPMPWNPSARGPARAAFLEKPFPSFLFIQGLLALLEPLPEETAFLGPRKGRGRA